MRKSEKSSKELKDLTNAKYDSRSAEFKQEQKKAKETAKGEF